MAALDLQIGIETEIFLDPRNPQFNIDHPSNDDSSNRIGLELKSFYNANKKGHQMRLNFGTDEGEIYQDDDNEDQPYKQWYAMYDSTVEPSKTEARFRWPIELASPILPYDQGLKWRKEVDEHFKVVSSFGNILVNDDCGLHVHMSPFDPTQPWTLKQLQQIACAILWFEEVFEVVLPLSRLSNFYTQSVSVDNAALKQYDIDDRFRWINMCDTMKQLIWLINPGPFGTFLPKKLSFEAHPQYGLRTNRYYGWNFTNLWDTGGKHTIEFRRAPGVMTARNCCAWVDFVAVFVQSAAGCDVKRLQGFPRNVGGLRAFILESAKKGHKPKGGERHLSAVEGSLIAVFAEHKDHEVIEVKPRTVDPELRAQYMRTWGANTDKKRRDLIDKKIKALCRDWEIDPSST